MTWLENNIFAILDNPATKWLLLVMGLVMPLASLLTWAERRQSAMMQDRLGPNRANIWKIKLKGILHFVADALKMISKEDFVPGSVHRGLFALAPILAIAPVLIAFAIIPFGPTIFPHSYTDSLDTLALAADPNNKSFVDSIRLQVASFDYGLLFYFAVLTLANYGGTIAGWASYNKWALLGGLRSSSQMMSYEVAMGLSLMGCFILVGSLEPGYIVANGASDKMAASNPLNWLWLWQFPALILFTVAAIAETKRAPFDIPEGEPRSSATSSSTPACAGACSSSPSSSRSSSSRRSSPPCSSAAGRSRSSTPTASASAATSPRSTTSGSRPAAGCGSCPTAW
jgi:NADH-quinone oxidoreductase subunit H